MWTWLSALAIAVIGTVIGLAWTAYREQLKSKREACAKFRLAFAEAITQIHARDAYSLMAKAKVQHDVAILEFRRHVARRQLANYDNASAQFNQCREAVPPAFIAHYRALGSDQPVDMSDIFKLSKSLDFLMTFAQK